MHTYYQVGTRQQGKPQAWTVFRYYSYLLLHWFVEVRESCFERLYTRCHSENDRLTGDHKSITVWPLMSIQSTDAPIVADNLIIPETSQR